MSSNGDKQHIYIDTSNLQSYLIQEKEEDDWRKEQVRKAIAHANGNRKIFVIFPFVVAGELINNLNKKTDIDKNDKQEAIGEFFEVLESEKIDLKPARSDSLKLAAKIKDKDRFLGDTDLLIASQALCDIYSVHLLMHDKKIIESQEIFNAECDIDQRIQRLKISDSIK